MTLKNENKIQGENSLQEEKIQWEEEVKQKNLEMRGTPSQKTIKPQGHQVLNKDKKTCNLLTQGPNDHLVTIEIGWTVQKFSGEVDLDAACLLFNKYGRFVETIFWDNLIAKGIEHKGDRVIVTQENDVDEESEEITEESKEKKTTNVKNAKGEEEEKEYIQINFEELDQSVTTLVFVLNIFTNKSFLSLKNLSFSAYSLNQQRQCSFNLLESEMKEYSPYNSLILAKIYRKQIDSNWSIKMLLDKHKILPGQIVDVLIPAIRTHVAPLVPTWNELVIHVLEGKGLMRKDLNGKSDPYVRIECEDWKKKTSIKKETLEPVWGDQFKLPFKKDRKKITFSVFDHDLIGRDEFIGSCTIEIDHLVPNKKIKRWFKLTKPQPRKGGEKFCGRLYIKLLKVAEEL